MEACLLSAKGTVEFLPFMLDARYYHGVIEVSSRLTVYVFGGGER